MSRGRGERPPPRPLGPEARLRVVDGMVRCPARGRVDIVECFLCDFGRGLTSEYEERVLCAWRGNPAGLGPGP